MRIADLWSKRDKFEIKSGGDVEYHNDLGIEIEVPEPDADCGAAGAKHSSKESGEGLLEESPKNKPCLIRKATLQDI